MAPPAGRQLAELLQEQQEPFLLDVYLLENGYSRRVLCSETTATCWPAGNPCRRLQRLAGSHGLRRRGEGILGSFLGVFALRRPPKASDWGRGPLEEGGTLSGCMRRTIRSKGEDAGELGKIKVDAERTHGWECTEEAKQLSPVSVLELQSDDGSPAHDHTREEEPSTSGLCLPVDVVELHGSASSKCMGTKNESYGRRQVLLAGVKVTEVEEERSQQQHPHGSMSFHRTGKARRRQGFTRRSKAGAAAAASDWMEWNQFSLHHVREIGSEIGDAILDELVEDLVLIMHVTELDYVTKKEALENCRREITSTMMKSYPQLLQKYISDKTKVSPLAEIVMLLKLELFTLKRQEQNFKTILELICDAFFKHGEKDALRLFMHRYRDVDPDIRMSCVKALGIWIVSYPSHFLKDSYLKYLGWTLNDKSALVRKTSVLALQNLYEVDDNVPSLSLFTERFCNRMIELADDIDVSVAVSAIGLLKQLLRHQLLTDDELGPLYDLLIDEPPLIRRAIGELVYDHLIAQKVSGLQSVSKGEDDGSSEVHLGRMLQILREFPNDDPILSAYVIDDVWDDMKAMKDWKCIVSMLLDENPMIELTDVDATNLARLLYASAKKAVGERIVPTNDNRKPYHNKAQKAKAVV